MGAQAKARPIDLVEHLHNAMNQHDLEAFLTCFDPDYRSSSPLIQIEALVVESRSRRTGRPSSRAYPIFTPSCSPLPPKVTRCGPNGTGPAPGSMKCLLTCAE